MFWDISLKVWVHHMDALKPQYCNLYLWIKFMKCNHKSNLHSEKGLTFQECWQLAMALAWQPREKKTTKRDSELKIGNISWEYKLRGISIHTKIIHTYTKLHMYIWHICTHIYICIHIQITYRYKYNILHIYRYKYNMLNLKLRSSLPCYICIYDTYAHTYTSCTYIDINTIYYACILIESETKL